MNAAQRICHEVVWLLCVKIVLRSLILIFTRVRILPEGPLPRDRGFIFTSNHVSHFDPPLLTVFFPRKIDWIAVAELFHGKLLKALFTNLNVIPVDRSGADRTALRIATKRLQEGRVVGIFPEGGIRDGAKSIVNGAAMKPGFALLSVLSNAPILPCVILGSERLYNAKNILPWRRAQVWIAYGQLIKPPQDLAGDAKREYIRTAYQAEIVRLRDKLMTHFRLSEADLPHSPQERMAEP